MDVSTRSAVAVALLIWVMVMVDVVASHFIRHGFPDHCRLRPRKSRAVEAR